jgi:hypothetical protein
LLSIFRESASTFQIRRQNKDYWFNFGIGRAGFYISATISTENERCGVELVASNDTSKAAFRALYAHKEAIEKEFSEPLEWYELPGKKSTRIAVYKHGVDPSDQKQYGELHAWMLAKMDRFRKVFAARVRSLPLGAAGTADEAEEPPEE